MLKKESLSFASEVKAFRMAGITDESDPNWPIRFLAFGHLPEPYTTLKNVRSLAKGRYLIWEHNTGKFSIARFIKAAGKKYITDVQVAQECNSRGAAGGGKKTTHSRCAYRCIFKRRR